MVPLKLFFVGYPRERISSGSGVPKAGFEPARVGFYFLFEESRLPGTRPSPKLQRAMINNRRFPP